MSTAISDIKTEIGATRKSVALRVADDLDRREVGADEIDLAFATVPRVHRGTLRTRALDSTRSVVDRRPPSARPRGGVVVYDRGTRTSAVRRARGVHPGELVEQAQVGFAVLAVAALLSALVVAVLITLAHLRAGDWGGEMPPVPAEHSLSVEGGAEVGLPEGVPAVR
ncbi:hypothetical protein [Nocardia brasiliensis]|uniref:hypothetical protein n=1 Tax=Nocardia brasiliensis TaxID=37326 RepID=UPI0024552965|nr:hypothetical protein [Nocardia brasiliensis]